MAALMYLNTSDGVVEIPRQFDDDNQPLPPQVWAVQIWGTPPPYDGQARMLSLPYHATSDALLLRERAMKYLPHWQLEVREVWVARAIPHDDAVALFKRWGW